MFDEVRKEKFKFNPFSGVLEEDLKAILVPKFNTAILISKIQHSDSLAIEFLGKQGRGKTTHLMFLHKELKEYPIFLLKKGSTVSEILNHSSKVVFVDSIHHLNFKERLQLFKTKEKIVYTTHWSRRFSCRIAKKKFYSIYFQEITIALLKEILNKRLVFASVTVLGVDEMFTDEKAAALIYKFGDNYRGIINHLYKYY